MLLYEILEMTFRNSTLLFLSLSGWWDSKKKNMESYAKEKVRHSFPKNVKISLLPCFWDHKYNFINNFIVRFVYEDEVTPSSFFALVISIWPCLFKWKNKIQNFCPFGFLCPWNFESKVWNFATDMDFDTSFWTKCPRCMTFAQAIVFQPCFMEVTTLISTWLQLSHNGSWKLL